MKRVLVSVETAAARRRLQALVGADVQAMVTLRRGREYYTIPAIYERRALALRGVSGAYAKGPLVPGVTVSPEDVSPEEVIY